MNSYVIINALKARQNFGEIINRAVYGGERFIVERDGKQTIKIEAVDREAQRRQEAKERFFAMREEILERVGQISEAELARVVEEEIAAVRSKSAA